MTNAQLTNITSFAKNAMARTTDGQHSYEHVDRVRLNALKITTILHLDNKIDKNLLQAAGLLHDILYIKHQPSLKTCINETRYLKKMLPEILKRFHLSETDRYILSEAVYKHTFAFPFRMLNQKYSLYAQIVQDADFLEFFSHRRLIDFNHNKQFSKFYKFLSLFSGLLIKRLKKSPQRYLNLPEIIDYFREDHV